MNWKDIKGYEGLYFISDKGLVKNRKGLIMKPNLQNSGYHMIHLIKEGKRKAMLIHRLVAIHFLGEQENMQVDHIDFNKLNNNLENLKWISIKDHSRRNWDNGKMELAREKVRIRMSEIGTKNKVANGNRLRELNKLIRQPIARIDDDGNILEIFESIKYAERNGYSNAGSVIRGKYKKSNGFKFIKINQQQN